MNQKSPYKTTIKLKIADIIIEVKSKFGLEPLTEEEQKNCVVHRFNNFFYNGRGRPDIRIKVELVDKLPKMHNTKHIFSSYHPDDGQVNWHLLRKDKFHIYNCFLRRKKQLMLVNQRLDKIIAYLLSKKNKGKVWRIDEIIYDFLQVLLINYFALHKKGIFVHGIAVKDLDGYGLLFVGKSGTGKSTTARLWHKHSKAKVLNDDRIIMRKCNGKFFVYGTPWHGDFSDYLDSKIESAPIEKLFFIRHAPNNNLQEISQKLAFNLLYPALFPTFWDKEHLENIASFCQDLIKNVTCYSLGFVNDKRVIEFVRRI